MRDWRSFQEMARGYFELEAGTNLVREVSLRLDDGQTHRFDLGSQDESVLIECKSYTFTVGGKEPAAKINHAKTDAQLLKGSRATRKIIVFDDDVHPKKGSLAELFARRNSSWLADVEVWRHWQGKFERIHPAVRANSV